MDKRNTNNFCLKYHMNNSNMQSQTANQIATASTSKQDSSEIIYQYTIKCHFMKKTCRFPFDSSNSIADLRKIIIANASSLHLSKDIDLTEGNNNILIADESNKLVPIMNTKDLVSYFKFYHHKDAQKISEERVANQDLKENQQHKTDRKHGKQSKGEYHKNKYSKKSKHPNCTIHIYIDFSTIEFYQKIVDNQKEKKDLRAKLRDMTKEDRIKFKAELQHAKINAKREKQLKKLKAKEISRLSDQKEKERIQLEKREARIAKANSYKVPYTEIDSSNTSKFNKIFIDANNQLYMNSFVRSLVLNKRRKDADRLLTKLYSKLHEHLNTSKKNSPVQVLIIFDDTKLKEFKSNNLQLRCARPDFKTSDDALVDLVSTLDNRNSILIATSDRELGNRLTALNANVCKSGHFFDHTISLLNNGEIPKDMNSFLENFLD